MKIGSNKLRMSNGSIRTFRSSQARNNFERVAKAYKHGWRPTKRRKKSKINDSIHYGRNP